MTNIADIIEPIPFSNYMMDRLPVANKMFDSGIVYQDAMLKTRLEGGGRKFEVPGWGDITQGESDIPVENTVTAAGKIGTYELTVLRQMRKKNIGTSALTSIMAGEDPLTAIQDRLDTFWKKDLQTLMVATITGVLASASGSALLTDKAHVATTGAPSASTIIAPDYIIDAQTVLGDAMSTFKAIIVHPKVNADLRKQNLITDIPLSDQSGTMPYYQDMLVIVDENVPIESRATTTTPANVYTSIMVREAAFAFAETTNGPFVPVDIDVEKDKGFGEKTLLTKRMFAFHPSGFDFIGTPAGLSPTNTELAVGTNWLMKQDIKLSGFVALKTN